MLALLPKERRDSDFLFPYLKKKKKKRNTEENQALKPGKSILYLDMLSSSTLTTELFLHSFRIVITVLFRKTKEMLI